MNTFGNEFHKPMLTEPGVKYFLDQTLKQCHIAKNNFHNILLLYKYKGKLTPEEIVKKDLEKKQYVLSKIRIYQESKLRSQQQLITGLPQWDNEFDIINDTPLNKLQKS